MDDKNNKKHPLTIGMRTIKTALSVLICMTAYHLIEPFGYTTKFDAFLACTAAIICMQDSMEKSFKNGRNRMAGTGIGALLGMIFLYIDMFFDMFFDNDYPVITMIAFGVVVLITTCNLLRLSDSIVIGCVVFLVIALEQTANNPFVSSVQRLLDTAVGVGVAIAINHFIKKPDK
ncbi:MAG: aromatic acid exporter family protein [Clostridiales Family XIII bacterium]|jgi:uncharacterized membrane protein YgaE (UPF0421/DUF939 family)|nr:aromatic acid exporter family protein [Clostridiales Family XIII bacterium]